MHVFTEQVTQSGTLTCYLQDTSAELAPANTRPAVLVLPGGAYEFCSDREAEPVALAYLAEGYNAFVLRYAVGTTTPWHDSLADAKAALAWMRENAEELSILPQKITAVGFSAGGHLAASLGTTPGQRPDALVLGYPVTLAAFGRLIGKEILDVPTAVDKATPPTFLFSTQSDTAVRVEHSLALLHALAENQVPFESHLYLLGGHGLSLAKPVTANGFTSATDPAVARWIPDSILFLERVLGTFPLEGPALTYEGLQKARLLGVDMPLERLLEHPQAAKLVAEAIPELRALLDSKPLMIWASVRELARFAPTLVSERTLQTLEVELTSLNS